MCDSLTLLANDILGAPDFYTQCAGQRRMLAAIAACSKPDATGLQQLVGPVGEQMQKVRLLLC